MIPFRVAVACLVVGVSVPVLAQPPKLAPGGFGRPSLQLKGLGRPAEQSPQQQAVEWDDHLLADLEQLRAELGRAKLPPASRRLIDDRLNAVTARAETLDRALNQNNRNAWYRAYDELEAAVQELNKAVTPNVGRNPAVEAALSRVSYSLQQLGATLVVGDNAHPAQTRRSLVGLAQSLQEHAERLRVAADGIPNAGAVLIRDANRFAQATARFAATIAGGNLNASRRELNEIVDQWNDLSATLVRFASLPPQVPYHMARIDGLTRRLAELLGVTPPQPPRPPPFRRLSLLAVGTDAGMDPRVVVYGDDEGTVINTFYAYNRQLHRSGVRVAVADLNGDGYPEVVTINGGRGHARLKVFDGRDATLLLTFDGFEQRITPHGYFVAAHDLTGDGRALVAIAPDAGGPPVVEVYDLAQGRLVTTVQAFGLKFDGGVRLAWGDVNGDGAPDLVTASGPGSIPSAVKVFDGTNFNRILSHFLGIDERYSGGLFVAAADLTKNNRAEIVLGLDAGHRPLVRIFDGRGRFLGQTEPFPSHFRGGVRVAIGDPDDGARLKIIAAPGPGANLPIRVIRPDGKLHSELDPFPRSDRGVYVASR
jgi:hypothetical protein